jgi:hyaluronoglucosaminidase
MELAVRLRPKATWGYYGRPGCYTGWNNVTAHPGTPGCIGSVVDRNTALLPLWRAQTGLFPSVYIGTNPAYGNRTRSHRFVQDEIGETLRLRRLLLATEAAETPPRRWPVIAFTWYAVFSSPCAQYDNCSLMSAASDLDIEFNEPVRDGVDGLIVWGSSGDVNSPDKCNAMARYVNGTLGPWLAKLDGDRDARRRAETLE